MHILIAGAGFAGLASALTLARAGHRVTLVERDSFETGHHEHAANWTRRGIAHFLQPHAFLPRGRRELIHLFPDVYQVLLRAGASDFSAADKIQGRRIPEDDELVYLSVRRPVIEWALRNAVLSNPNVSVFCNTRIADVLIERGGVPKVFGIATDTGETITADLVVDALGRNTPFPAKLASVGCNLRTESTNSEIIYYSRYFRMFTGKQFPRGPWLVTPRGDLGYAAFSTFTGDNGTFALLLAIGSWDRELRVLQNEGAWNAVAAAIPTLAPLVDPHFATPITGVLPMGELQNTLRHYVEFGDACVRGFVPVGDTVCHTDPTFALGLSFALIHARALRDAIQGAATPDQILPAYWKAIYPETRERYDYVVAADEARAAKWQGAELDQFHADGCFPLFTMAATAMAAQRDDEIFRKTLRRMGFLDRLSVFDHDTRLHRRIEQIVEDLMKTHRISKTISRARLLKLANKAAERQSAVLR
ncbi:FAD dependent oxidoreductase [Candidatus Koribacter versatilis Ellin345]|uniref:FAD dependent oxidoreductase n=1 Tax=Koribacter versatilis (strain Ellin345) TaxID=204669 RepID=Q1IJ34_KORVE|nr:FAD-dependent oxidoreductase [Candidatus Koribacter versatilis]ABF43116.1 FAD dependent oxidoreductase [Candidatus Koribacter versatilis Ellin345]